MDYKKIKPPTNFTEKANINSLESYQSLYKQSIEEPDSFWAEQAKEHLSWFSTWDQVSDNKWSTIGEKEEPYISYFKGATINASYNCIDRHLESRANKTAIKWIGEDNSVREITFQDLHDEVCKLSIVFKNLGLVRGDRVSIYLPMIPEMAISILACARLGLVHSVVFSAFSADALKSRIEDCESKLVITANTSKHAGKISNLKEKVDQAIEGSKTVTNILIIERDQSNYNKVEGRDVVYQEEMSRVSETNLEPAKLDAEHPLFILYTSGSTGKPKGVLHTTGGYLLYTTMTAKYIFDLKEDDIFWCTADVGWITGHSYLIYGPLSNGATCIMYEGTPTYPHQGRFWEIIQEHKVSIFYTAPTAIRALMKLGDGIPNSYDLKSLRLIGTVGEPINPEAWIWYYKNIGKESCPVIDTWWQTETGGIMLTTFPGVHDMKPGSAGFPFFGIQPEILSNKDNEGNDKSRGSLVIKKPWPGIIRGVFGDKKNTLIKNVYFSAYPDKYYTADGARIDEDGHYWLLGRIDDVINVSGHRLSTAEIESALVSHPSVAEAAVVGIPHEIKGQGIYCYVTLKDSVTPDESLTEKLITHVRAEISPIATPDHIQLTEHLPKTRSGKIMRRILRKIAEGDSSSLGDISTLADPSVVAKLIENGPK